MDDLRTLCSSGPRAAMAMPRRRVAVDLNLPGIVAIRDSKDPVGAKLLISPAVWRAFIHGLKRVLCL